MFYKKDQIVYIPKKILEVRKMIILEEEKEQYVYNIDWIWMTESEITKLKTNNIK